jgi:hypothetical protein
MTVISNQDAVEFQDDGAARCMMVSSQMRQLRFVAHRKSLKLLQLPRHDERHGATNVMCCQPGFSEVMGFDT